MDCNIQTFRRIALEEVLFFHLFNSILLVYFFPLRGGWFSITKFEKREREIGIYFLKC